MNNPIVLSVNPWYYCNFKCDFCYLTKEQLSDKQLLPLDRLAVMLDEVLSVHSEVQHVDIYGGEVLLLPVEYLQEMKALFHSRGVEDLNIITNLSVVNEVALDEDFELSISYDFNAREKSDVVLNNIFSMTRRFNILSLASRQLLDTVTVDEFVNTFNLLTNLWCVEIKPYSENQANCDPVTFKEFEDFVWAVLNHPDRKFYLENESLIRSAVESKSRNAFSDNHVYITPDGHFAVLEFDLNDKEYFLKLDSFDDYRKWCDLEKERVNKNDFCSKCQFKGKCLSEHLRDVKSMDNSCNGFHGLLMRWVNEGDPTQAETRDHT